MKQTNARTGDTVGYVVVIRWDGDAPLETWSHNPKPRSKARAERSRLVKRYGQNAESFRIARVVLDK